MLTRPQAEKILDEILRTRSETDEAECKEGLGPAFEHALCAMSNRKDRNGGVIFIGVDRHFVVIDPANLEQTQAQASDLATQLFNVQLRVELEVLERTGRHLIAVIVPACPSGHRPCHFKRHKTHEGTWIRVGNSTRLMTQDEIRREIAADEIARGSVPPFDSMPLPRVPLSALDDGLIADYIERVKKIRPGSQIDRQTREQVLSSIRAIDDHEGKPHPTPAGLLFFSREPQRYLPQSSVEFLHLWGPKLTSLGPDGSRWRLNREASGTLPQIIDAVEHLLLERIATRGIIDGFRRHDEPEYPRFALREAIVNAVAHRDYTLRGSRIQIALFPDRIEIHTPGGLPPPVTVENIENEQSTRNEAIVNLLQDYDFMERRGYGFNGLVAAMREAGLAPPLLRDDGASFELCLMSHVLMSPEALAWLKQFDGVDLSPQEKLALAYLRVNNRLYNRDYARLADCPSTEATRALRGLVDRGLIAMQSRRGGAYYMLPAHVPPVMPELFGRVIENEDDRILNLARMKGSVRVLECITDLKMKRWKASKMIKSLVVKKKLTSHGAKRNRYYTLT